MYTSSGITPSSVDRVVSTTDDCNEKWDAGLIRRQAADCTITKFSTTTYGVTVTYLLANVTTTYTEYTAFTQKTVSSTRYGGTTYSIATSTAIVSAICGPAVNASAPGVSSTVTQDAKCAPSALVSAAGAGTSGGPGYGLSYLNDVTGGGSTYRTFTNDGSECCQLCVEAEGCSASVWDIRSKSCRLEFSVSFSNGQLNCGTGALVFYDYGPDHPMAPGTGWYVGTGCGGVEYAAAKPDDGT